MKILITKFLRINIDEKDSLLDNIWSAKSSEMTDNQYKSIVTKQIELIEKYRPQKVLLDTTNFDFIISPIMQKWVDNQMFPRILEGGVKFIGIVVVQNIFAQVSVEQQMNEKNVKDMGFKIKYFKTREEALEWLLSF